MKIFFLSFTYGAFSDRIRGGAVMFFYVGVVEALTMHPRERGVLCLRKSWGGGRGGIRSIDGGEGLHY